MTCYSFLLEIIQREDATPSHAYRVISFAQEEVGGTKEVHDIIEMAGDSFETVDHLRKFVMKLWAPLMTPKEFRKYWAEMKIVVHNEPKERMLLKIGREAFIVDSFEHASRRVRNYILDNDLGQRDFKGATIWRADKKLAIVHYNGALQVGR